MSFRPQGEIYTYTAMRTICVCIDFSLSLEMTDRLNLNSFLQ